MQKYDRGHRLDKGALRAYKNGERPISRWSKKLLLKALLDTLEQTNNDRAKLFKDEVLRIALKDLKNKFLKVTGTHLTGNYFRHTDFYRVLNVIEMNEFIEHFYYKPTYYVQQKLF